MDRAISLEARRIDLAIEPPFHLGPARIDPPAHEIGWKKNMRRVQPQTMKVLVALHDKLGQVVTRDELVDRCWDGRFVGEDVINRCISLLRRVAAESGGLEIQTVPRGGYRLIEQKAAVSPEAWWHRQVRAVPLLLERQRGRAAIAAIVGLLVLGSIGAVIIARLVRPAGDAVMLEPFDVAGSAPAARTLAAGVSSDVAGALSAAGVDVVDPGASRQSDRAAFILGGRAELPGANLHLTAELQDARDHTVLWSTSFTRPSGQMQAMQEQVAANIAAVLHCALDTSRQQSVELDQGAIKLYLQACALQQSVDPPLDQITDLLKQVTAREPNFADAWSRLAFTTAISAFAAKPADAAVLRRDARNAAQTALRLDARQGLAYEALTDMELGRVPFAQLHREFQKALSVDPNNADILDDDGELLLRMGSVDDGLRLFRRSVELAPLAPQYEADLINGLVDDGRDSEAQAELTRALRIWPDDNHLKIINLDYQARFGDPDAALAILANADARPDKIRDVTLQAYRGLAETRKAAKPERTRAFIAWLAQQVASGQIGVDFAAPHMAQLGDVDGAFKLAFAAPDDVITIDPEFLWEPESVALRRDPRFIALAAKFHVAAFWNMTGRWPDFCSSPNRPYNCKVQERLLLTQRAQQTRSAPPA